MKQIIVAIVLQLLSVCSSGQIIGETWTTYATPEHAGWSSEILQNTFRNSNASSMMLVYDGKVVAAYGEVGRRFKCHSVRKSLLNALYGIYVEKGEIDLGKSLKDLNICDIIDLTESERSATVRDLLTSRSGVYFPSGQETQDMKDSRPERGSHLPGTYYYYNNWDFNVLGTIFMQETGRDIFREFYAKIATPLQMEDFRVMDGAYDYEYKSQVHPAYPFKMSARDMARFGQLYLQHGRWNGRQVIPENWITETIKPYSTFPDGSAYGYLWWIDKDFEGDEIHFASGYGGQLIFVWPSQKIVLVLVADTYTLNGILDRDFVVKDLLVTARQGSAKTKPAPEFSPLEDPLSLKSIDLNKKDQKKYMGEHLAGRDTFSITSNSHGLLLEGYHYFYQFRLLPVSHGKFYVEDLDLFLYFSIDENQNPMHPEFHKSEITARLSEQIREKGFEAALITFPEWYSELKSKEELRFLAGRLNRLESLELHILNAICFPYSFKIQQDLATILLKEGSWESACRVFKRITDSLNQWGISSTQAHWFYEIILAQANPVELSQEEKLSYEGYYGDYRIETDRSGLVMNSGERKIKLYRINENLFAVENRFSFRILFEKREGPDFSAITMFYYRDTSVTHNKKIKQEGQVPFLNIQESDISVY